LVKATPFFVTYSCATARDFHTVPFSSRPYAGNLTVENKVKNLASNIGFILIGCIFLKIARQKSIGETREIAF
jgi:hypothetical protein